MTEKKIYRCARPVPPAPARSLWIMTRISSAYHSVNLSKFILSRWVEHDPMEIWASQSSTLVEVLAKADISSDQIAAIGITNQRETAIVWERETGKPIYNAIVWQCRRTADICEQLKRDGPKITSATIPVWSSTRTSLALK